LSHELLKSVLITSFVILARLAGPELPDSQWRRFTQTLALQALSTFPTVASFSVIEGTHLQLLSSM